MESVCCMMLFSAGASGSRFSNMRHVTGWDQVTPSCVTAVFDLHNSSACSPSASVAANGTRDVDTVSVHLQSHAFIRLSGFQTEKLQPQTEHHNWHARWQQHTYNDFRQRCVATPMVSGQSRC